MKITIDYNNDKIYINPDERYEHSEVEYKWNAPLGLVQSLLVAIFDIIEEKYDGFNDQPFIIELEKLDEDTRSTIGEW